MSRVPWYAVGYKAGERGALATPPGHLMPMAFNEYQTGYLDGLKTIGNACIICGSLATVSAPAKLAPFIVEYVFGGAAPTCERVFCPSCQFVFSSHRFTDREVEKLYGQYRSPTFVAVRAKHEPDYPHINELLGKDPQEIRERTEFCHSIIKRSRWQFESALDYGGGEGHFVPENLSITRKYVYEISSKNSILRPDQYAPYDLILCSHVLEHVPDPLSLLASFKRWLAGQGLIYLEVPGYVTLGPSYENPVFHEHINHFTARALERMIDKAGLQVIHMEMKRLDIPYFKQAVIGCLCSK